jgi:hypothetical protein
MVVYDAPVEFRHETIAEHTGRKWPFARAVIACELCLAYMNALAAGASDAKTEL